MGRVAVFLLVFLFSCAGGDRKESLFSGGSDIIQETVENISLEKRALQKLRSHFELLELLGKHTEFDENILLQLKDFPGLDKAVFKDGFRISDIRRAGEIRKLSDSVQELRFYYDILYQGEKETDSMGALITSKSLLLEGKTVKITEIDFVTLH